MRKIIPARPRGRMKEKRGAEWDYLISSKAKKQK